MNPVYWNASDLVIEALKSKWFGVHFVAGVHADIHQQAERQTGA